MTHVLATVKPGESAAHDRTKLATLTRHGVAAIRVNLGRRSLADNRRLLREAAAVRPHRPTLFADLPGIKGRLGLVEPSPRRIRVGEPITLATGDVRDDRADHLPYHHPDGCPLPTVGDVLALADGGVRLRVTDVHHGLIGCVVECGEAIPRFAGVVPASGTGPRGGLTDQDRSLARAVAADVDFLCPSFADDPATVTELSGPGARLRGGVIAKVETPRGVAAVPELAACADGLMVARGDLSIFYDGDQMRAIAERITALAREQEKIVVFATNFLRSLAAPPYRLTDDDRRTLDWVGTQAPDYLLLNETAYSPAWEEIAATAVDFCRGWTPARRPAAHGRP